MLIGLRVAARMLALWSLVCGLAYPLAITAIARVAFPRQAAGSLIRDGDVILGSELVGQEFSRPEYFWGRLSATAARPYDASASGGSNLGPMHPDLEAASAERASRLRAASPSGPVSIPVDLITASGSGLDPHVSPAAALWQAPRVAAARGVEESKMIELVRRSIEPRDWGVLGEPRVNVLRLNLELDRLAPRSETSP